MTEAGFGADIGMEKFCNIKCRYSGEVTFCKLTIYDDYIFVIIAIGQLVFYVPCSHLSLLLTPFSSWQQECND